MRPSSPPHPIICYMANLHGVPAASLIGPSRRKEFFLPRAIACYLLVQRGYGLSATGRLLDRHHTSVMHALAYIQARPELQQHADQCLALLATLTSQAAAGRTA